MNKNRIRTGIAVLTLAGAAALAPIAPAGADPAITGTSGGVPLTDLGSLARGQALEITGTGCVADGQQTYSGEFVSGEGDPWTNPGGLAYETANDANGSFVWSLTVPEDSRSGVVYIRWYCATSPATDLTSAKLWVGPMITMTLTSGVAPAGRTSAPASTSSNRSAALKGSSKSVATTGGTMTMTTDPDALPAVDQIGVTGDKAAKLKAKVDAKYAKDSKGLVLLRKLLGRNARAATFLDGKLREQYVNSAASVLGVKKLPNKAAHGYADRLSAGEIRVAIVEDLALSVHDAAWYNAR